MKKLILVLVAGLLVACSDSPNTAIDVYIDRSIPLATSVCKDAGGLSQLRIFPRHDFVHESCGYKCSKVIQELTTFKATCKNGFVATYAIDVLPHEK